MLSRDLARYVDQQRSLGFKFRIQSILLSNFVAFAEERGDRYVASARVLEWASGAPSPETGGGLWLIGYEDDNQGFPGGSLVRARGMNRKNVVINHSASLAIERDAKIEAKYGTAPAGA